MVHTTAATLTRTVTLISTLKTGWASVEDASYVEARFLRTLLTMSSTGAAWTTDPPYSRRPQEERQTPADRTARRGRWKALPLRQPTKRLAMTSTRMSRGQPTSGCRDSRCRPAGREPKTQAPSKSRTASQTGCIVFCNIRVESFCGKLHQTQKFSLLLHMAWRQDS